MRMKLYVITLCALLLSGACTFVKNENNAGGGGGASIIGPTTIPSPSPSASPSPGGSGGHGTPVTLGYGPYSTSGPGGTPCPGAPPNATRPFSISRTCDANTTITPKDAQGLDAGDQAGFLVYLTACLPGPTCVAPAASQVVEEQTGNGTIDHQHYNYTIRAARDASGSPQPGSIIVTAHLRSSGGISLDSNPLEVVFQ